jgi:hypothetical protein
MKHNGKTSARQQYRLERDQRVKESPPLSEKYRDLKSLKVRLAYCGPEGNPRGTEIKYDVNLEVARSVFSFDCPNVECIGGDFDLSDELARAIRTRRKLAEGEMCCHGWYRRATSEKTDCRKLLRYTLALEYRRRPAAKKAAVAKS